jgi:hypothetical protein
MRKVSDEGICKYAAQIKRNFRNKIRVVNRTTLSECKIRSSHGNEEDNVVLGCDALHNRS